MSSGTLPPSVDSVSWVAAAAGHLGPSADPELTDLLLADRFRLEAVLGRGGFGVVYRARDERLDRVVALKILRADRLSATHRPVYARRFLEEAAITSRLGHAGIVVVHDVAAGAVGADDVRPFLVTELLEGQPLRVWSAARPPLGVWLGTMIELGDAIAFAHDAGVLHRDIKPENVMITARGAKILDFGLAEICARAERKLDVVRSLDLRAAGTPGYMPPEQLAGLAQTEATDLFAWGVVMYESLAGERPRTGPDHALRPLDAVREDLPRGLVSVIHGALELAPSARPPSARAITEILRAQRRLISRQAPRAPAGAPPVAHAQPYPGLRPFEADDASHFFGRAALAAEYLERLRAAGDRAWLALEAPSGRGKSSFVRAGLLPLLRARWVSDPWVVALRPGPSLRAALCVAVGDEDPLRALARATTPVVLVIDQLEELAAQDAPEHALALALVRALLDERSAPTVLITALRSDLTDALDALAVEAGRALRLRLPPLDEAALREVVEGPAALAGAPVEPALTEALVSDVSASASALPLLAETLRALWASRGADGLTLAAYRAQGGLGGAARLWGDAILAACPDHTRLRALLLAGVAHDGERPRSRLLTPGELRTASGEDAPGEALRALVLGRGGLRPLWAEDDQGNVGWIHESMIGAWPTLAEWVAEEKRALMARTELETVAASWARDGRPRDALVRGEQLAYFGMARAPSELARALLDTSRAAEQRRARNGRAALVGALLVAIAAAVVFAALNRRAEQERAAAEDALAEARRSEAELLLRTDDRIGARQRLRASLEHHDRVLSRALAWRLDPLELEEGERGLSWRISLPRSIGSTRFVGDALLIAADNWVYLVERAAGTARRMPLALGSAEWAEVAPNSRRVWVVSRLGGVARWDLATDKVESWPDGDVYRNGAAVGADGRYLITAERHGARGAVRLWLTSGGGPRTVLTASTSVEMVALSRDGARWAAVERSGALWVGDVEGGRAPERWAQTRGNKQSFLYKRGLLFDGRGRLIVAAADERTRIYTLSTGSVITLDVSTDISGCMDVSPDGRRLVTPTNTGEVVVWDLIDDRRVQTLVGHVRESVCASFGGPGEVVSSGLDRTVRVWDVERGVSTRVVPVRLHHQIVPLSSDGAWLPTHDEGSLSLWSTRPTRERPLSGHATVGVNAVWLPGGAIATTADDATLRLWDVATGRERWIRAVGTRPGPPALVDGRLVVGGRDVVTAYEVTSGAILEQQRATFFDSSLTPSPRGGFLAQDAHGRLLRYRDGLRAPEVWSTDSVDSADALASDREGRRWAVGRYHGVLEILDDGGRLQRTIPRGIRVLTAAFHPREPWLALGALDPDVWRVELNTGQSSVLLRAPAPASAGGSSAPSYVRALAFDATGEHLAFGVRDGRVRVLALADRTITDLGRHDRPVGTLSHEPGGLGLVSGGFDGTARTWRYDTRRPWWRTVLASADPPELLTHRGWEALDGGPLDQPSAAWRAAAARAESAARRGDRACTLRAGVLEAWDVRADRGTWSSTTAGAGRVRAEPEGCVVRGERGLALWPWSGARPLTFGPAYVDAGWSEGQTWWATAHAVGVISAAGTATVTVSSAAITAAAYGPRGWLLGLATGELRALDRGGETVIMGGTRRDRITRAAWVAHDLVAAGDAAGTVWLWSSAGDVLRSRKVHGPISELEVSDQRVVAATELGSEQVWSLEYFALTRCALLARIRREYPAYDPLLGPPPDPACP